jgi:hypothetical protein
MEALRYPADYDGIIAGLPSTTLGPRKPDSASGNVVAARAVQGAVGHEPQLSYMMDAYI